MKKSTFDGMIDKYREGKYSGKHKEVLDQWFDIQQLDEPVEIWTEEEKRDTKRKIFQTIDDLDHEKNGYNKTKTVRLERKVPRLKGRESRKELRISPWFRIAAAVLAIIIAAYLAWINKTGEPTLFPASSGKITKVMLDDGSIVWLKGKNSKLIYPETFTGNERHVSLQGEALFEVVEDPQRPFIIQCGALRVAVLGTSFNIRSDTPNIEVVVLTGKVSVSVDNDEEMVVLLPNEKVVYNDTRKHLAKTAVVHAEASAAIEGTEYRMAFQDTRLKDIIRRIEGKFGVAISVSDLSLCNCLITADFTGRSLNTTLEMLSRGWNLDYAVKGSNILLDGEGCK